MALVPLETPRAVVRAVTEADLDAVHAIIGDAETTADVSWRQADLQSTKRWIKRRMADERRFGISMWAVQHRDTSELIGLCGFFPHELPEIELGYVFRADYWGQGWASEVVPAVLDAGARGRFDVYATIRSTNHRSLALAERIGLTERDVIEDERGRLILFRWQPTDANRLPPSTNRTPRNTPPPGIDGGAVGIPCS